MFSEGSLSDEIDRDDITAIIAGKGNIMRQVLSFLLVVTMSFFLFSCSPSAEKGSVKDGALSIKGFSLGMDLDAAKENAVRLFGSAGIDVKASEENKIEFNDSYQLMILEESGNVSFLDLAADNERRLTRFSFHPRTLDLLFDLKGQDNDSIARKVMEDFNLPELIRDENGSWEYREVEGIRIKLQIKVSNRFFTVEGFVTD